MPPIDPPAPPPHLSLQSAALWASLVPDRVQSPPRLAMLRLALEAIDRADAAREVVAADGMTTTTARSGVTHLHPLLRVERESRQLAATLFERLHLMHEPQHLTALANVYT